MATYLFDVLQEIIPKKQFIVSRIFKFNNNRITKNQNTCDYQLFYSFNTLNNII